MISFIRSSTARFRVVVLAMMLLPLMSFTALAETQPSQTLLQAGTATAATTASAQPGQAPAAPNPGTPTPSAPADQQASAGETAETLHVMVGRSLVISSPGRLQRVSIADPAIADAVIVSPTQIMVNGKAPGTVSLVLWSQSGQSQAFEVTVELDAVSWQARMRENFPNEAIRVGASKDVLTLSGRVSSPAVAEKALELAKAGTPKVVSLLEVPLPPAGAEILLQVKFAEVDRSTVNQLAVNLLSLPGNKIVGTTSTQQFGAPALSGTLSSATTGFQLGDLLNVFAFRPDINLAATIKALEQKNLLQILAEPNVLTESGKEGSFLAGGEFPVPIVQPGGAGGVPVITIQWKQFGVLLQFAPTLGADGLIHLKVRPEVSTLDFANGVTITGFRVPAISTRRVESEMELQDGQSFAIAGLVDNRVQKVFSKMPGIGDIPILGKLFQSRDLTKSTSELLVVVTPHIVKGAPPGTLPAGPRFPDSFIPCNAADHQPCDVKAVPPGK